MSNKPRILYLYGMDGVGKTTISRELIERFSTRGKPCVYRWMRYNHYLTRCINGCARILGLATARQDPDGTVRYIHEYGKNRFFSVVYMIAILLDLLIATIVHLWGPVYIQGKRIVLDRYVYDILIDIQIDTARENLITSLYARMLRAFLSDAVIPVYVWMPMQEVILRRKAERADLVLRYEGYEQIYRLWGGARIDNSGMFEETIQAVERICQGKGFTL